MRKLSCTAITLALLAGCMPSAGPVVPNVPDDPAGSETSGTYTLGAIDEVSFTARATLVFGPGDQVGGQGPCNRWSADLTSTLPAFQIGPIVATEMACDDLVAEMTFFRSLALMEEASFLDGYLFLKGYQSMTMAFRLEP
jgi:heat shock protein HslJ